MSTINNVIVFFQPDGASVADAVPAVNQHVYIDLTAGTMTYCKTDATGKLVASKGPSPVSLDDSRSYRVVVSPKALPSSPVSTAGTAAKVSGGKLVVVPLIAIKVVDGATPQANLVCTLGVGATNTNVKTTSTGWIISNDQSAGAVTLSCATKTLKAGNAATPKATLAVSPSPAVRDTNVTVTITPPSGVVGFKVAEWKCQLSFRNPGDSSHISAMITRPANESPATFNQKWEGTACAPSTARVKFVVGATVRASGNTAVAATLSAVEPDEVTAPVAVIDRTGTAWQTKLTQNKEADLVQAIHTFHDLGQHEWTFNLVTPSTKIVKSGPHRGCEFVSKVSCAFVSSPRINKQLKDATSAFSKAQNAAYMIDPAPARLVPRNLYTVGAGGDITETSPGAIATHFGLSDAPDTTGHCIDQTRLLAFTRRHESTAADGRSHKENCLKALRALEPVVFIEAMVQVPGASVDFTTPFRERVHEVADARETHEVVDEAKTQEDGVLRFTGKQILEVDVDDTGALAGPVWDPVNKKVLEN